MRVYCVYLGDVYIKSFDSNLEAKALSYRLKIFLTSNGMDVDLVKITEEDI